MARGREAAPEAGSKIDQSCVSSDREEETQRRGTYFSKALRSSSRLRFEDFSQTFPAMLLRLVGTADPAGDCEKTGVGSFGFPERMAQLRFLETRLHKLVVADLRAVSMEKSSLCL